LSYKDIRRMLIECGFIIEKSFPLDVMSGMVRSRLFGKYAKNFLKETFPLLLKESSSEKRSWITKMFLQEDIYHNHLEFFLHEIAGFFYRYSFAFICKKPTIS
ncbi:hypothetical protein KKA47_07240, partial [bacterium]|nr:hypothetical protein [bacterium]